MIISDLCAGNIVYHFEKDTVILPCYQLSDKIIIWYGPVNLIYAYGTKINPDLPKSRRLSIIHTEGSLLYNLQIRQFSSEDEGLYRCVGESKNDVHNTVYNLTLASMFCKDIISNIYINFNKMQT